jgi:acyl-CoA thioester hydrolase
MSGAAGAAEPPLLLHQGSANAWECDEMGHLNVRFHVERAVLGLAAIAAEIGMPAAFGAAATATLTPLDAHVRFLREARPGAPLRMLGGVVSCTDTEAEIYQELRHLDGAVSSTFRLRVAHTDPATLAPFPWSSASRAALARLACAVPAHAAPRSINLNQKLAEIAMARARALGAPQTGRSVVAAPECDAFGRLRFDHFIARVSDAVPWVLADWRARGTAAAQAGDGQERKAGGAAVEFRIAPRRWPRAGDHIEVRSAITEVMPKANRLVHWLIDPVSGGGWASVEAVAISFDLVTRKAYEAPPELRDALAQLAIAELTP